MSTGDDSDRSADWLDALFPHSEDERDTKLVPLALIPAELPDLADFTPLGEGGMGTVFRARQVSLDRFVAVKTIRADFARDPVVRERFEREAKALARFEHPNIVPVHFTGSHQGFPYYVMRLVQGTTIDQHLEGKGWKEVAVAFRKVAAAIETAHNSGVLHRDIKPRNILVDERGEPVVVDFGLAKREQAGDEITEGHVTLGTPDYLPPEVLRGAPHSRASDIYSLGVTLYRVLAGRTPYARASGAAKLHAILEAEPELPRQIRPGLPEPLQAICLEAMERDEADRYQSAGALADDLSRFAAGETVRAKPTQYGSLLRRRVDRQRDELEAWEQAGLIDLRERDELAGALERLVDGDRDSIFELPRLSTALVLLYVGVLVLLLGPAVLLARSWDAVSQAGRLAMTATPLAAALFVAWRLWRRSNFRTAIPLLVASVLLTAATAWVVEQAVPALSHIDFATESGVEVRAVELTSYEPLEQASSERGAELQRVLDLRVLLAALPALLVAALLRRITHAPALVWVGVSLGIVALHAGLGLTGWRSWPEHWQSAVYLPPAFALMLAGIAVDRRGADRDARPLYVLGYLLASSAWYFYARTGHPALHLGEPPHGEEVELSFVAGGILALILGWTADRVGTLLLRRYSAWVFLTSPVATLFPLSLLVDEKLLLYEVLLPLACLAFVLLAIVFQRKNLLYAGGAYLSVAVFQIAENHFEGDWRLPFALLLAGATTAGSALLAPKLLDRLADARSSTRLARFTP